MARYRRRRVENGLASTFEGGRYVAALRERDGPACVYCATAEGNVVDHMLPISAKGTDDLDNLALACAPCNCGKAGRPLSDDGAEIKSPSARAAYVRYVRDVRARGEQVRAQERTSSPAPTCAQVVNPSLPSLRSEELERSPLPSVVAPRHAKPNGFARFWEAYPKKVAKGAAEKAFAKALKRLTGHDPPGQLIEAVHRAKLSRQWLEGYVPNPATWLNDARWEDEIEPPREPHERTHPDPKFTARQANLAAFERGADLAARLHRDT